MCYSAACGSLSFGNYVLGRQMKLTVGAYLSQLVFCKPHKTQYVYITHQINQRDGAKPCLISCNRCDCSCHRQQRRDLLTRLGLSHSWALHG